MKSYVSYPISTQAYSEHSSWLTQWLKRRMGCAVQASDLTQDTFERLLKAEANQSLPSSFNEPRHYLVTVAKRVMIDYFRRKDIEKAYLEALAHQPELDFISEEQRFEILETLQALDKMLDGLGHNVKQAFIMSQLQGLPYLVIAEELKVSVSSVTKYMAKATEHCLVFALEFEIKR